MPSVGLVPEILKLLPCTCTLATGTNTEIKALLLYTSDNWLDEEFVTLLSTRSSTLLAGKSTVTSPLLEGVRST